MEKQKKTITVTREFMKTILLKNSNRHQNFWKSFDIADLNKVKETLLKVIDSKSDDEAIRIKSEISKLQSQLKQFETPVVQKSKVVQNDIATAASKTN